jgi:hypothetical protein
MKPFDERFADRVRDVFDAYEEPVDPAALDLIRGRLGHGYEKVIGTGKFPVLLNLNPVTRRFLAAATILLISAASLALWAGRQWQQAIPSEVVEFGETGPVQPGNVQSAPLAAKQRGELSNSDANNPETGSPVHESNSGSIVADLSGSGEKLQSESVMTLSEGEQKIGDPSEANQYPSDPQTDRLLTFSQEDSGSGQVRDSDPLQDSMINPPGSKTAGIFSNETVTMTELHPQEQIADSNTGTGLPVDPAEPLATGITEFSIIPPAVPIDPFTATIPPQGRKSASSALGITAGSMVTYAGSQLAGGVGFFAGAIQDVPLTRNMSLSTGGLIAWNQFGIDPAEGMIAEKELAEIIVTRSASNENIEMNIDYDSRRDYNWVAIDIPVNMKWDVGENSRGNYNITLGVSSLLYLQQTFRDEGVNYSGRMLMNLASGTYEVDIQKENYDEKEEVKAFSRFDFARLLNISMGYSLKKGKNPLSFELYLKYPLGRLTTREISMGMGGISVRYSIGK